MTDKKIMSLLTSDFTRKGCGIVILLKRRIHRSYIPVDFRNFFKTDFSQNTSDLRLLSKFWKYYI